jgi:hypothetical protein
MPSQSCHSTTPEKLQVPRLAGHSPRPLQPKTHASGRLLAPFLF